ncbi:uncharacterized protein SCODWIG_03890 [Saccharomycodes ludwigii]|uniref:Autophagy-related protein 20 n=1 Tax=Saccharomycodes ludwigii TaxID=36035 RepID=A0A376BBQ9_9ASCO|nr:hypothetical protein SCDLUD_002712 [Saccharomycodes ludwigii]KAH3901226.1 hypothetical protein SCDLUD_002712 [Saccharomycodes ludwigii]SSD62128.1 uncharacterized protein SCODWIG_03890 [Saccharomycodes ludwigii]
MLDEKSNTPHKNLSKNEFNNGGNMFCILQNSVAQIETGMNSKSVSIGSNSSIAEVDLNHGNGKSTTCEEEIFPADDDDDDVVLATRLPNSLHTEFEKDINNNPFAKFEKTKDSITEENTPNWEEKKQSKLPVTLIDLESSSKSDIPAASIFFETTATANTSTTYKNTNNTTTVASVNKNCHENSTRNGASPNHVVITEAVRTGEGQTKKYISYSIKYGNELVRRRYSDFELLRNALLKLFPMILIPPIPKKETIKSYGKSIYSSTSKRHGDHGDGMDDASYMLPSEGIGSINLSQSVIRVSSNDELFIRHRISMLTSFLNRLLENEEINKTTIIADFLNPEYHNYKELLNSSSTMCALLTSNIFQLNPLDPTNTNGIYKYLPIPQKKNLTSKTATFFSTMGVNYSSSSTENSCDEESPARIANNTNAGVEVDNNIKKEETDDGAIDKNLGKDKNGHVPAGRRNSDDIDLHTNLERHFKDYSYVLKKNVYKNSKNNVKHLKHLQSEYKELSQIWGQFSNQSSILRESTSLSSDMAHISNAYEESYLNLQRTVGILYYNINEPLYEFCMMSTSCNKLIEFRKLKKQQLDQLNQVINDKTQLFNKLKLKMNITRKENNTANLTESVNNNNDDNNNNNVSNKKSRSYGSMFFKKVGELKTIVKETVNYSEPNPNELMPSLEQEINRLLEVQKVAQKDLDDITEAIENNEIIKYSYEKNQELQELLINYTRYMRTYAQKNLEHWKSVKENMEKF